MMLLRRLNAMFRDSCGEYAAAHCRQRAARWLLLGNLLAAVQGPALAVTWDADSDVVGALSLTATVKNDTIADIARAYDQGYKEMRIANPTVDAWLPGEDTEVIIPGLYVLPDAPHEGIVINVPEMRFYYFPKADKTGRRLVTTHPISIGRQQWVTPHGVTKVVGKVKNPSWTPPESIRKEHAAEGDPLPRVVPPGPDNPLGAYALRLGLSGYLIHGTDKPYGIGMRVTHGCIRMYPSDIESVYETVPIGTAVRIVNQPYKIGISQGQVYLEVHPHLDEDLATFRDQYTHVVNLVIQRTAASDVRLDWKALKEVMTKQDGIPSVVGTVSARSAGVTSPQAAAGNL